MRARSSWLALSIAVIVLLAGASAARAAVPAIVGLLPQSGPIVGGNSVNIYGNDFVGVTGVMFGPTNATSYTVVSPTQITATAPPGGGSSVHIRVTNMFGTSAISASDEYNYIAGPSVSMVNPSSGPAAGGTHVTIVGVNLGGATAVTFGGTPATDLEVYSNETIGVTAPPGAGTVDVQVTTPDGTTPVSPDAQYTYVPAPTITSVSPAGGPAGGGTNVTITGTGFTGATAVTFGAQPATSLTVDSDTQIAAIAPAGAVGPVDIHVTSPGGPATMSNAFRYVAPSQVTDQGPADPVLPVPVVSAVLAPQPVAPAPEAAAPVAETTGPKPRIVVTPRVRKAALRPTKAGLVVLGHVGAVCPAGAGPCDDASVGVDVRLPGRANAVTIGRGVFAVADGRTAPVAVQLSRQGRRLLAHYRSLTARVTLTVRNARSTRQATRTVTVLLAAPPRA
jgi:hypothetical protein